MHKDSIKTLNFVPTLENVFLKYKETSVISFMAVDATIANASVSKVFHSSALLELQWECVE